MVFQQNQAFPATSTYYYSLRTAADVINAEDLLSPYKTRATIFLFTMFVLGVTQWLWGRRWDLPSFASSPGPPPSPSISPGSFSRRSPSGDGGILRIQKFADGPLNARLCGHDGVLDGAGRSAIISRPQGSRRRANSTGPTALGHHQLILSIDQCLCSPAVEGRAGCRVREWIARWVTPRPSHPSPGPTT